MFRIVCDPSSGSTELCLTEITISGSQTFFVCLVGVWQRNFEPAVCVHGTCAHTAGSKLPPEHNSKIYRLNGLVRSYTFLRPINSYALCNATVLYLTNAEHLIIS